MTLSAYIAWLEKIRDEHKAGAHEVRFDGEVFDPGLADWDIDDGMLPDGRVHRAPSIVFYRG